MAAYADYYFYITEYNGTVVSKEEFPSLAAKASALIDRITFGRATGDVWGVKMAVCAAVDTLYRPGGGVISSENNDGYSVTYASGSQSGQERAAIRAVRSFLPPELTNRGCW